MTEPPSGGAAALFEPVVQEIPEAEAEFQPVISESINDSENVAEIVSSTDDQPGGTKEGIKVHGHWTIDISDSDGKLVSHNEFENALVTSGGEFLPTVLAHQNGVGYWMINLGNTPCATSAGAPSHCTIQEGTPAFSFPMLAGGLIVEAPTSGPNSGKFVLSGSITAGTQSDISVVQTLLKSCDANTTPANYASCSSTTVPFTGTTLNPVVPVLVGQTIDVTVVISFS